LAAGGALVLSVLTGACGSSLTQPSAMPTAFPTPTPTPTPPPPPKVALLSVDGLRPDALTTSGVAPNILALALRGSYTWSAQTIYPSTTLPGHTSMLTGLEPIAHGVDFDMYRDTFTLKVPTVLSLVHAAGGRSVMVVGKDKFRQLAASGGTDSFVIATRGDADVANEVIALLPAGFEMLFVHFPDVDVCGHTNGWMSSDYLDRVRKADEAVGRVLQALPAETTVILTADHGGQDTVHGTRQKLDMTIPWIIAGPKVVRRGALTCSVRTVDTALTILHVLGIQAPGNVTGSVVVEPFQPQ
jgi:predicted AlkP superfamily pyrophosphatase or phosphodiesterase